MSKQALIRMQEYQNAILKHFWASERSAVSSDVSRGRPKRLYHYTGVESAISILGGDNPCGFAFTHYRYLNDREEYDKGVELAMRWLYNSGRRFLDKGIVDKIMHRVEKKKSDQSCVPYVLSFTAEKDSTPQWMAYTDKMKGGYAIGVDFGRLQAATGGLYKDEDPLCAMHFNEIMFAPCIYYKNSWEDDSKAFLPVLECLFGGIDKAYCWEEEEQFSRWCAKALFQFAAILKNENFRFEQEWRLVIRPSDEGYVQQLRFIGGKPRLLPAVLPLRNFVDRICVSPNGNQEMLKLTAELICLKLGRQIRVKNSQSSYIGG